MHLFIGTRSDNMRDMFAKGRHEVAMRRGDAHHRTVLTDAQIGEIRARTTGTYGEKSALAREYGVSANHIGWILSGKRRAS